MSGVVTVQDQIQADWDNRELIQVRDIIYIIYSIIYSIICIIYIIYYRL